jgi:hypothetical protein
LRVACFFKKEKYKSYFCVVLKYKKELIFKKKFLNSLWTYFYLYYCKLF